MFTWVRKSSWIITVTYWHEQATTMSEIFIHAFPSSVHENSIGKGSYWLLAMVVYEMSSLLWYCIYVTMDTRHTMQLCLMTYCWDWHYLCKYCKCSVTMTLATLSTRPAPLPGVMVTYDAGLLECFTTLVLVQADNHWLHTLNTIITVSQLLIWERKDEGWGHLKLNIRKNSFTISET